MADIRKRQADKEKQTQKRIEELLGALDDPDPHRRESAWSELDRLIRDSNLVSREMIYELLEYPLLNLLDAEQDPRVLRKAFRTVFGAFLRLAQEPQRSDKPYAAADLGRWLWNHFHDCSRVLRVADPDRHRRDEDAVIEIARELPRTEFPHTEPLCVDPGKFAITMGEFDPVKTVCFVGRLGLYGKQTLKAWKMTRRTPRYRFGLDFRPPDLPPGRLHPEYHAIVRAATETEPEKWYRTHDAKETWTDYALIQRYVVRWSGRARVVILIAGCTALGTLAAAHFASCTLLHPGLDDRSYPLPPSIDANSSLEILIQAVADTQGSELGWKLRELKLLDLRVDDFAWNEKDESWKLPKHDVITLVFPSAAAVRNYRRSQVDVTVKLDGKKINFRRDKDKQGSENWRLCVVLCMAAKDKGGQAAFSELGSDPWIWKGSRAKSDTDVKTRVRNFRRVFGSSFEIDDDFCRVVPEVRVEIQRPAKPR